MAPARGGTRQWLHALPGRLASWWMSEFVALFPATFAARWIATGVHRLQIRPAGTDILLELSRAERSVSVTRISRAAFSYSSLTSLLAASGWTRRKTRIVVELPETSFFFREFDIPVEAQSRLAEIATLEIRHKTPFDPGTVYHGAVGTPIESGRKLRMSQAIVRRDILAGHLDNLSLAPDLVDDVTVETGGSRTILVPVRPAASPPRSSSRAIAILAATAALLALSVFVGTAWRQQQALHKIERGIAAARPKATLVRATADRYVKEQATLAQIRSQRAGMPSMVELWEEVTRLLPNESWATELRLVEGRDGERLLSLTGFAPAATSLVDLLERSPKFTDAVLTAPITFDPDENRERFAVQMRVRNTNAPVNTVLK